jgi:MFS family permease
VLGQPLVMWPLLFMAGCGVMGFYTLGLTVLGQRFPPEQLAAGNVIFVAAYMIGGIAGPVAGGAALDVWMPHGFPMMLAALFLGFVLFGLATVRRG